MTDATDDNRYSAETGLRWAITLAAVTVLVAVATASAVPGVAAAQATEEVPGESGFAVAVDQNGSARVTLALEFNLSTPSEQAAFEALRENQTARQRRAEQFARQMQTIAARAQSRTDREMRVHDPGIAFARRNDSGTVALSVTWENLAARSGDRVIVREPFASNFTVDRPFRVHAPDGYELSSVTPSAADRSRLAVAWNGDTTFDRFEATFAPADADSSTATPQSSATPGANGPGFGTRVVVFAVLIGSALLGYGRRRQ